jgi:NAD+ kinase
LKNHPSQLHCVGLIANPEKPDCRDALRTAARLARRHHIRLLTTAPTQQLADLSTPALPSLRALSNACQLLLVFGGDGTILRVARETAGLNTPLLGINVGNLGFLTAVSTTQLPELLPGIWKGNYQIERRSLIQAQLERPSPEPPQLALNDFVISRRAATRLIELEVVVNNQFLTRYRCDGLIVSSPTGSTAYSLAAGGAIVTPDSEVFALTPICPHTLSNRPVILNLRSQIQVRILQSRVNVELAADGQVQTHLHPGDTIRVQRSRHSVQLLWPEGSSFFETLRLKLRWSGSTV